MTLGDARRRLYEVFAGVPRPERVAGCPHCVTPGEEELLLALPVAHLGADDLERYGAKAISTWGGPADLRYFAARLLDLAASGAFSYPDTEVVFGKLALGGWRNWPEEERDAVGGFLLAWWDETLARYPAATPVDTVLACVAATGTELGPFLASWGRLDGEAGIRHLHDFMTGHVYWHKRPPRLANPYWDRNGAPHRQTVGWLLGGIAIEATYERESSEEILELLATMHSLVVAAG